MASNPVPTLGTQDFIFDSANKFAQLFADFMLSDYNQTYLYPGTVTSVSRIMQLSGQDEGAQVRLFQDGLSTYLRKYYDEVSVSASVSDSEDSRQVGGTKITVIIQITETGVQATYGRLLTAANNTITKVENLINFGK